MCKKKYSSELFDLKFNLKRLAFPINKKASIWLRQNMLKILASKFKKSYVYFFGTIPNSIKLRAMSTNDWLINTNFKPKSV